MRTFLIFTFIAICNLAQAQLANLQFVHCSADSALAKVDIWIDTVKVLDDFSFKTTSSYLSVVAFPIPEISICPKNSTDTSSAIFKTQIFLTIGSKNIGFINGQPSAGYLPSNPISIFLKTNSIIESSQSGNTDVMIYQGVSDLPSSDFSETTLYGGSLANNISYNEFSEYTSLESLNYRLKLADSSEIIVKRLVELRLLSLGFSDSALTIISAGFNNPSNNIYGPSLNLYLSPPSGGNWIPLPISKSKIQVINNSPDIALNEADIYLGGSLFINNLGFRVASQFLEVPAGLTQSLAVANGASIGAEDSLLSTQITLEANKNYVFVLNGLVDENNSHFQPLSWTNFEARTNANLGYNTDIILVNGAPDLGSIKVDIVSPTSFLLFPNTDYSQASSYSEVPAAPYHIQLRSADDVQLYRKYVVDLSTSEFIGSSLTWVLSGFSDTLLSDSNSQLGIWVATNSGGSLFEWSKVTGVNEIDSPSFRVYPNPTSDFVHVLTATQTKIRITSLDGRLISETTSKTQIDVRSWPSGVYLMTLESAHSTQTKRLEVIH